MEETSQEKVAFWVILFSKIIVWILGSVAIYWLLLKLTNHSPSAEQISTLLLGFTAGGYVALIGLVIYFISRLSKHIGKSDHFMHYSEKRFDAIGRRFDLVDERFQKVNERFEKMEDKMDERFGRVDERFQVMQDKLNSMERKMDERLVRMESKLDKLIMCKNYKPGKAST